MSSRLNPPGNQQEETTNDTTINLQNDERSTASLSALKKDKGRLSQQHPANRLAHPVVGELDHAIDSQLGAFGSDPTALAPDEALALGVIRQAARDLHTFHSAQHGIERELYLDAYRWIVDEDYSWPYSFVNVCALLGVPPDAMRAELLADAALGWCAYWKRIIGCRAKLLRVSLGAAFRAPQTA